MSEFSTRIPDSRTISEACDSFLADLGDWVRQCIRDFGDTPVTDGHDQGTFTTSWGPYIRSGGQDALSFVTELRDRIRDHFVETGKWRHGYWRMQEVHHGTEHFEVFLGKLYETDPDNARTRRQIEDMAEHLGNWVPEVPEWYDWDRGVYRSFYFGADGVRAKPGTETNTADHLRCVNVALLAYRMSTRQRYLDLAWPYGRRWAGAIVESNVIPCGLSAEGGVTALPEETAKTYSSFAGAAPELVNDVNCGENLLASGGVQCMLNLWELTQEAVFRKAAQRVLDVLVTQLSDPDAGSAADAVRHYRNLTGDCRYDRAVLDAVEAVDPFCFAELRMDSQLPREGRESGIGKRTDRPAWYQDARARTCNPITLSVAAEILGDQRLATRAVDLGRAYFHLARQAYPHGRRHGCSARTVSAVARGHGRENGSGVVTAVLEPMRRFAEQRG